VTTKAGSFKSGEATVTNTRGERRQLLDPVDRISETLFGLSVAATIFGSLSIAIRRESVRSRRCSTQRSFSRLLRSAP
jgi:hypothetical protein